MLKNAYKTFWKIMKYLKTNQILLCKDEQIVKGISKVFLWNQVKNYDIYDIELADYFSYLNWYVLLLSKSNEYV